MVMAEKKPSFMKGKYTEAKDKKKDASMLRKAGLDKDEKQKFEKLDKAHGAKKKPATMAEDKKIDSKLIKKVKSEHKKHEAKESKRVEKKEK
jgi:hypothetical protein